MKGDNRNLKCNDYTNTNEIKLCDLFNLRILKKCADDWVLDTLIITVKKIFLKNELKN